MALACGILCFLKGSGKKNAIWYKAFVLQIALSIFLRLIGTLIMPGPLLSAYLMIGCVLFLEVGLGVIAFDKGEALPSIIGSLTHIVLIGSIGIVIRAKYADKAARGK